MSFFRKLGQQSSREPLLHKCLHKDNEIPVWDEFVDITALITDN